MLPLENGQLSQKHQQVQTAEQVSLVLLELWALMMSLAL